jgi:hypothetical protein
VGIRAGLDAVVNRKTAAHTGNRTPTVQPVAVQFNEGSRLLQMIVRCEH